MRSSADLPCKIDNPSIDVNIGQKLWNRDPLLLNLSDEFRTEGMVSLTNATIG